MLRQPGRLVRMHVSSGAYRREGCVVKVEDGEAQHRHERGLVRLVARHGGVVRHEEALCKGEEDDAGDEEEGGDLRESAANCAPEDAEHRELRCEPAGKGGLQRPHSVRVGGASGCGGEPRRLWDEVAV